MEQKVRMYAFGILGLASVLALFVISLNFEGGYSNQDFTGYAISNSCQSYAGVQCEFVSRPCCLSQPECTLGKSSARSDSGCYPK